MSVILMRGKPRIRLENGKWKCGKVYFVNGTYFGVRSTTGVGNTPEEAYMDWYKKWGSIDDNLLFGGE